MGAASVLAYGVVQGLAEFLPVSSSGHLVLLPRLLGIPDPGLLFDLAMHVGTALAVMVYFRGDLRDAARGLLRIAGTGGVSGPDSARAANLALTTLVSVACVLALSPLHGAVGRDPRLVAFNLAFFGVLMALCDLRPDRRGAGLLSRGLDVPRASLIGALQGLAVFPGVSRSGATIGAARLLGLGRAEAARYSFLLALPLILGGFLRGLLDARGTDLAFRWAELAGGALVSFLVGLLAIHWFLGMVRRLGLWVFAAYRVLLAAVVALSL